MEENANKSKAIETVVEQVSKRPGVEEIRIITGNTFEEKAPVGVVIEGTISSVGKWLEKNKDIVPTKESHVIVNRESGTIILTSKHRSAYEYGIIKGSLQKTKDLEGWHINADKSWEPEDLANHVRMNRHCFESKEVAMKLFSDLKNFRAKVNADIEKKNDDRGNTKMLREQAVETNLPESFRLNISAFKGEESINFLVEVIIHPQSLECILISPELKEHTEEVTSVIIDREIELIKEYSPDLVVFES